MPVLNAAVILRQDVTVIKLDIAVAGEAVHFVNLAVIDPVFCLSEQSFCLARVSALREAELISLGNGNRPRRIDLELLCLLQRQKILAAIGTLNAHPARL